MIRPGQGMQRRELMKKVTLVLLTVCLCFGLCFSAYADDMYYQGDAKYPIAFVQWGNSETGFLFSAGLLLWEALKGKPFRILI